MSQLQCNSIVPVGGIPAGASGGGIVQVVSTLYTTDFSFSSTTAVDVTSFSASMACRNTSNKVLIQCQGSIHGLSSSQEQMMRIKIGASTYTNWVTCRWSSGSGLGGNAYLQHLYSPASTSSITYQVQVMTHTGGTCYMNRDFYSNNNNQSNITLLEISA